MGLVVLLIAFLAGWAIDRWRLGLRPMVPIATTLTALCFVTPNNPALTAVEASLSFSPPSILLNFAVKFILLALAYSLGRIGRVAIHRIKAAIGTRFALVPASATDVVR